QVIRLVLVVGRDPHPGIVVGAAHGVAIGVDHSPRVAAVFRAPDLTAVGFLTVPRYAVARFDHRVDTIRITVRDGHRDAAHRPRRQASPFGSAPGGRRASVAPGR